MKNILLIISLLTGAGISSQAPEFAQQYRQRLGGALNELHVIAKQFDEDAEKVNLDRDRALLKMESSTDTFISSRGISMHQTLDRFTALQIQQDRFNSLHPATRPIALLSTFDETLANDTWQDYEPAIPLNLHGLMWSSVGGLLGMFITWLLISIFVLIFKPIQPRRKTSNRSARWMHKKP